MGAISNAIGSILDNYADVIEGGNSWRGSGTSYLGIPGRKSNDPQLNPGVLTVVTSCLASSNGAADGTTIIDALSGSGSPDTYNNQYWVKITSGACYGEWARIIDDDGAGVLTLDGVGFSAQIVTGVDFDIYSRPTSDSPLTVESGISTTILSVSGAYSWDNSRWAKENTPGYWLHCTTSGGAGSPNLGCARKISGWDNSTKRFTVAALPVTPTAGDVFEVLQGFKRIPDGIDIESDLDGVPGGFDRFFSLQCLPGRELEIYGAGSRTYETELQIRLRMSKAFRVQKSISSVLENLAIIRQIITRGSNPNHRDGTYTVALLSQGGSSEIVKDDKFKIVAVDKYRLIYKINGEFT